MPVVESSTMESRNQILPSLPPPPGAISALTNGFNAVANNIAVIIFPVALDIFLWLGPRLKADAVFGPILKMLPDIQGQAPAEQVKLFTQMLTDFSNGFNLFSVLRTYPLGIFSLMSTNLSVMSPLGPRSGIDAPNMLLIFMLILVLTFCGWMAGSLYFRSVSRAALKLEGGVGILRSLLHGGLLSGVWMLLFAFANLPLLIFLWLLTMMDGLLRTVVIVLLAFPVSWVLLVVFFSFFGIFVSAQNAFVSVRNSMRMLRYGLPPLGWFAMLALFISQSMDLLWRIPPAESWMTAVGILGHAFISTGLLAASFIYYRDLNVWIAKMLQAIQNKNSSPAQA